ncbi:DUF4178 domain-containing protein [Pseudoalteromonas sp. DL2-H2.2]|uniref:DUF4178 domain-containing protein n=1 Tax=Pseudoalteromonas sp. DL2-H2.2 TaxID=2908889 RepID=UPI001F3D29D0|nr:DUF4178 domain-containing protein [Pseudoalteromonas sp. DL2-H2.2]MCF2908743.1 DUF4178 domain-containing protein [Pseudoalteromonas sp. DL2-H2.2]
MFGFFKSKKAPERQLNHARDLRVGDMLSVIDSFAYPDWLKGQTLKVVAVQTYQYQRSAEYEFVLESESGKVVFLQIEQDDGEEFANFSVKIQRDDVDAIFTLDEFARIFDEESLTRIETQAKPAEFERFLGQSYQQSEAPYVAYYHEQDYRGRTLPRYQDESGDVCEVIELASPDEKHSINIEVWDGGETEVSLTLTRPLSDIVDLFPGAGE